MRKIAVNACRLVLAVTLILSGFVKAVDPLGTQYKIQDYLTAMGLGGYVPDIVTLFASVALSTTEFLLGICLLFAIRRRLVSKITLVMMAVMTLLTLWLAIADALGHAEAYQRVQPVDRLQLFRRIHHHGGGLAKPLYPAPLRLPSLPYRGRPERRLAEDDGR